MGALAEADEGIGKGLIGVHGDVAGDVVEDVGLGEIVEVIGGADGDGGGELAVAEAVEEEKCGDVAADGFGFEAGHLPEEAVDVREAGDVGGVEVEGVDTGEEMVVGVAVPAGLEAGEEGLPGGVVRGGVEVVGLGDEDVAGVAFVLDEGSAGGGQAIVLKHGQVPVRW